MTIKEFTDEYNKKTSSDIGNFIKKHITTNYISIVKKISDCERIITSSCYQEEDGIKKFRINSFSRYLLYVLNLIDRYTDINIDYENVLETYDTLNKDGCIAKIIKFLPETEVSEYETLLNMILDDTMENERSFAGFAENKSEALKFILYQILAVINEVQDEKNANS